MLIELTSFFSGAPVAIAVEMVGIVKPVSGSGPVRTFIGHKTNCRRHWTVTEPYDEVMRRIRAAEAAARSKESEARA